jgi:predicted RNA-binding protein with PUA-like domain
MPWILKTEPSAYSYADLERDGQTRWDGVRNYQARNNLKTMEMSDLCLIYESVGPREIVGTARVIKTAYPDPKDINWTCVDIRLEKRLKKPISLAELKEHPVLKNISLVKQSRLSVCPISKEEWAMIAKISDL